MKKFMLLMYGFEKPTPEIMEAWGAWFESVADRTVDQGGFHGGALEISASGTKPLPMGMESITGYTILEAENLDEGRGDRSREYLHREHPRLRDHGWEVARLAHERILWLDQLTRRLAPSTTRPRPVKSAVDGSGTKAAKNRVSELIWPPFTMTTS